MLFQVFFLVGTLRSEVKLFFWLREDGDGNEEALIWIVAFCFLLEVVLLPFQTYAGIFFVCIFKILREAV